MNRTNLAALALCGSLIAPLAAQDMIGTSWTGTVYRVDSATGAGTVLGSTGHGSGANAMAVNPAGRIYCGQRIGTFPNNQWLLLSLDPNTGIGTQIGGPQTTDYRGLAFDAAGTLYAIVDGSPDQLYTVDPTTAIPTIVGGTGYSSIQGFTWASGQLYAWDLNQGLLTVDPFTGVAIDVDPSVGGRNLQFLATRSDGALYGGQNGLFQIDPLTGIETLVGSGGYRDLRGCDFTGPGCSFPFGNGCAGAGGFRPRLQLSGCATSGGSAAIDIVDGPGGAPVALIFGVLQGNISLGSGCSLHVQPLLPVMINATLMGAGPGNGTMSLSLPIPVGVRGTSATTQALIIDTSLAQLFTTSNGLEVIFQ